VNVQGSWDSKVRMQCNGWYLIECKLREYGRQAEMAAGRDT
jgi:hypothetical protein